ncbi:hypothetical protein Lalb_Chr09g0321721 [Lupinus albus]|uniref:Uncharacterized protein n=1 Tax=Lupinus albus TaxID=3870 RepID=A0A6A4PY72_LUPAL|nr:hypothetical protein Lalb_Chr09g0321721 [Lupinus albus]
MSRLDRFLISSEWAEKWPNLVQLGLMRMLYDHCVVILSDSNQDWGPKPFRVLNAWFNDKDFTGFVEKTWTSLHFPG